MKKFRYPVTLRRRLCELTSPAPVVLPEPSAKKSTKSNSNS